MNIPQITANPLPMRFRQDFNVTKKQEKKFCCNTKAAKFAASP
jgi:hypothetical protein